MRPAGLKAFQHLKSEKSAIYAYEQRKAAQLEKSHEQQFRSNKEAWDFFQVQPAWYRRTAAYGLSALRKKKRV
jgi:hypothetical protein